MLGTLGDTVAKIGVVEIDDRLVGLEVATAAVSYTHLTLPTSDLV